MTSTKKLECKDLAELYGYKIRGDDQLWGCCYDCHEYEMMTDEVLSDTDWGIAVCCQTKERLKKSGKLVNSGANTNNSLS